MPNFGLTDPAFIDVVDDSSFSRDGLVLHLDAGDWYSYPRTGTVWKDLSGRGRNLAILSTAYNGTGPKYMDFNGSFGCGKFTTSDYIPSSSGLVTAIVWTRVLTSNATWRTLFRGLSTNNDHQVIIEAGGYNIGMYNAGFRGTGYLQTSIPGWNTGKWNMLIWRWPTVSPYYQFGYNDTPTLGTTTDVNAAFHGGICSIGAYNDADQNNPAAASQYWGDISSVMIFNRLLSNQELLGHYQARKNRFGL